ncbi:hypothetical protein JAAARDRAFT_363439 [Jaapia argillacea MUCL 33604]|uniref:Uncharacterized protein n=1 Tax=Jaapia argillacea MUCL 33604 TaxID=933084 RepID=A0A067QK74_9AGAM|nr:hypothetical protein JAAARDRAFT_363439 [Jaapia argillacea MUCL 33604]
MAGKKRPASPVAARKNPKQPRGDQSPVIDVDSEVDSDPDGLAAILALIKQQEESEALAIKLHSELNDGADVIDLTGQHYAVPSASTSNGASGSGSRGDAIDVDDEDVQMIDSPGPSSSDRDPQASHAAREAPGVSGQNKESSLSSYSHPESTTPPDVILSEYRSTFTRTRKCTKCGGDVESPRGFVSPLLILYFTLFLYDFST